jgi:hypothetical protein
MTRKVKKLFGFKPDPEGVERWLNAPENKHPLFGLTAQSMMADTPKKTTLLYEPLLRLHPSWRRGSQGIGDCVSWGFELGCTMLMAADIAIRNEPELWKGEAATESIYGGCRVEAEGGRKAGYSDGAYGGAAAKWVRNYGVLLREDYSKKTGQASHDLMRYDSKKAKDWGNFGNGGKNDAGKLDKIAREHPVRTTSMVTSFEEAAAAISNYYPVPVCSNQGFTSSRDSAGFAKARGSWSHCMLFCGVRYGKRPGLLCTNSWGHSCDGPTFPKNMPTAIAKCSWWVNADVCDRMLRGQDSYALSGFDGYKRRELDWSKIF